MLQSNPHHNSSIGSLWRQVPKGNFHTPAPTGYALGFNGSPTRHIVHKNLANQKDWLNLTSQGQIYQHLPQNLPRTYPDNKQRMVSLHQQPFIAPIGQRPNFNYNPNHAFTLQRRNTQVGNVVTHTYSRPSIQYLKQPKYSGLDVQRRQSSYEGTNNANNTVVRFTYGSNLPQQTPVRVRSTPVEQPWLQFTEPRQNIPETFVLKQSLTTRHQLPTSNQFPQQNMETNQTITSKFKLKDKLSLVSVQSDNFQADALLLKNSSNQKHLQVAKLIESINQSLQSPTLKRLVSRQGKASKLRQVMSMNDSVEMVHQSMVIQRGNFFALEAIPELQKNSFIQ